MKKQFRPGSVVRLKSGSSNMIVVKYDMQPVSKKAMEASDDVSLPEPHQALVSVTWFEEGKWKGGKFDPDLLVLVK